MDVQLASPFSLSSYDPALGVPAVVYSGAISGRTATAWPAANRAILLPVRVGGYFTIRRGAWENGTVSGNVDCGVYTSEGKLVASTGSVAQAGVGAWQSAAITPTTIPPGWYYIALALDNATGQIARSQFTINAARQIGCCDLTSGFPLPASATRAPVGSSYWPSFQIMAVSVL